MSRRLIKHVFVPDGEVEGGQWFAPGDDVPDWVAEKIVNPKCWEEVEDAPVLDLTLSASPPADDTAGTGSEPPEVVGPPRPPEAGPGASRDAWATYAAHLGLQVEDMGSRNEIIAAVIVHEDLEKSDADGDPADQD